MRRESDSHEVCTAMADVLNRIGDKWSVMVVGKLTRETLRFNQLRNAIGGISQRMLTLTLRNLERDGLVTRTVFPEIPPRVEYALTPLGRTLTEPLDTLWNWAAVNKAQVAQARSDYDRVHAKADALRPERRFAGAAG